jgi:hypothetical protein
MRVSFEVVSDGLIGHVIHPIQVPRIFPDFDIILRKVHVIFFVKVALSHNCQ